MVADYSASVHLRFGMFASLNSSAWYDCLINFAAKNYCLRNCAAWCKCFSHTTARCICFFRFSAGWWQLRWFYCLVWLLHRLYCFGPQIVLRLIYWFAGFRYIFGLRWVFARAGFPWFDEVCSARTPELVHERKHKSLY